MWKASLATLLVLLFVAVVEAQGTALLPLPFFCFSILRPHALSNSATAARLPCYVHGRARDEGSDPSTGDDCEIRFQGNARWCVR